MCAPKEREYDIDPDLFDEEPITMQPSSDYQSIPKQEKIELSPDTNDDENIKIIDVEPK